MLFCQRKLSFPLYLIEILICFFLSKMHSCKVKNLKYLDLHDIMWNVDYGQIGLIHVFAAFMRVCQLAKICPGLQTPHDVRVKTLDVLPASETILRLLVELNFSCSVSVRLGRLESSSRPITGSPGSGTSAPGNSPRLKFIELFMPC